MIDTSRPTYGALYVEVYTVINAAGLTATVLRIIEVADPCAPLLRFCVATGMTIMSIQQIRVNSGLAGLAVTNALHMLLVAGQCAR